MSFESTLEEIVRRVVREEMHGTAEAQPEPDLVKLPNAAKRCQVSVSWLKARIADGSLPAFGPKRLRRVKPGDVRALLQRQAAPTPPQSPTAKAKAILASLPGGRR